MTRFIRAIRLGVFAVAVQVAPIASAFAATADEFDPQTNCWARAAKLALFDPQTGWLLIRQGRDK